MKKLLTWLLAIMLCLGLVPSFAEGDAVVESGVELNAVKEEEAIIHNIKSTKTLDFDDDDFIGKAGKELSYIKFTKIDIEGGSFQYDGKNTTLNTSTSYYVEAASKSTKITKLSFKPKAALEGTTTLSYVGCNSKGETLYEGDVVINVTKAEKKGDLKEISYSEKPGEKITFTSDEFITVCKSGGCQNLSYIIFDVLPDDENEGILYDKAASNKEVDTETSYYVKGSDESTIIDKVFLQISEDATEDFDIEYSAYDESGDVYKGVINVEPNPDEGTDGIHYTVTGKSVSFIADEFNDVCLDETKTTLKYVKFGTPANGTLYYMYDEDEQKTAGSKEYYYEKSPYIFDISYVPDEDFTGIDSVSYTAWSIDNESFKGTVDITVTKGDGEELADITESVANDSYRNFTWKKFNDVCEDATGESLDYLKFELPSSTKGTLYYNYSDSKAVNEKVDEDTKYYRAPVKSSDKAISDITFVPKSSATGKVEIYYFGYTEDRTAVEGKVVITIKNENEVIEGEIDTIVYDAMPGDKIKIDEGDVYRACRNANIDYSYIKFASVNVADVYTIYSGTSKASTSTKYNSDSIEKLSVQVNKNAEESFDIAYTAYVTSDEYYKGYISINLDSPDDEYDIYYEVTGESVAFTAADFRDICKNELGTTLSYVKFKLPSDGVLYYDYEDEDGEKEKVSAKTEYYYSKEPYLYNVSYVPEADYKGYVYIDYEGFVKGDDSFLGTVTIYVNTSDVEEAKDIDFGSIKNTSYKRFSDSSFKTACSKATGETLSYVKFDLPSSNKGTLYYNYSASKDDNEKVSDSKRYYVSEEDYIKNITFVPKSGSKGEVSISYTGFTKDDTRFTGEVIIDVTAPATTSKDEEEDDDSPSSITYSGDKGKEIKFDAEDFYDIADKYNGEELYHVEFTLPSSSSGVLYYDYGGSDEAKIKETHELFYDDEDEMLLSEVSFVPAKVGKTTIKYTAYTEDDEYTATVVITVKTKEGTDNFSYRNNYKKGQFSDVDENEWYGANGTQSVMNAYRYGLMQGNGDGTFNPKGNMKVSEALTIAARIHDTYYNNETEFETDGKNWYDDYVTYALNEGIIRKSDFASYEKTISREEMAYIFANIIPSDELDEINEIETLPDVDEENDYFDDIIFLYQVGVLTGNDAKGTFLPKSNISRAEVSAIIVRLIDEDSRIEKEFE